MQDGVGPLALCHTRSFKIYKTNICRNGCLMIYSTFMCSRSPRCRAEVGQRPPRIGWWHAPSSPSDHRGRKSSRRHHSSPAPWRRQHGDCCCSRGAVRPRSHRHQLQNSHPNGSGHCPRPLADPQEKTSAMATARAESSSKSKSRTQRAKGPSSWRSSRKTLRH